MDFDDFYPQEGSQNDPKCSPRRFKRTFFFMPIFDLDFGAFWGRLGVIFGSILAPKIDQKIDPKNDQNFDAKKTSTKKPVLARNGKRGYFKEAVLTWKQLLGHLWHMCSHQSATSKKDPKTCRKSAQIDPKSIQIDPKSTQNRSQIDPSNDPNSIQNRFRRPSRF